MRLAIKGRTPHQINLDTVDADGATLRHVWTGLTREQAERIASRIIEGNSLMLASCRLPVDNYELVI